MSDPEDQASDTAQEELLQVRLSAVTLATIQRALEFTGETLSEFIVNSAHEAAEALIRERVIVLSPRDSILVFEALLNPEGPNEALQEAARRHGELFGPINDSEN